MPENGFDALRLSVVTPSFNQGRFLEQTIRSVLLQNYPNLEYLVIDGGSSDESTAIIEKYRPWLTFAVSERDRGQAHALNKGFEQATGVLRAYINSDDFYRPGAFTAAARALRESGEALAAGICDIVNEDGEVIGSQRGAVGSMGELADLWGVWRQGRYLPQPAVFWRHAGAAPSSFREELHLVMDYEFWGQCLARGARVIDVPDRLAAFRVYQGQKSDNRLAIMLEAEPVLQEWLDRGVIPGPHEARIRADLQYAQLKRTLTPADGTRSGTLRRRAEMAWRIAQRPRVWRSPEFARELKHGLSLRRRTASALNLLRGRRLESTFEKIAARRAWGGRESVSGTGSSLRQTRAIREQIPRLLRDLGCASMLDAPCGDFHWLSRTPLPVKYLGCDIVTELVARNNERYSSDRVRFFRADITRDALPRVDLILCRDCLVHLPNDEIRRVLENFAKSDSRYLLTTTFPGRRENRDIVPGHWRPLNLQLPPFDLPSPLMIINEECTEFDGAYRDKSLGLWDLSKW